MAAALVIAHALVAGPAHAQHTSGECPAQTATVSAGGTVTINITDCAVSAAFFSTGPVDGGSTPVGAPLDFPDHGAANLRISGGQWFVDYSHNGSTGIGSSDVFEFTEGTGTGNGDVRVTITIQPAATVLTVTPGTLPTLTAGTTFSQTLSTTGGTGPYSYGLQSGTLPPGVSLSPSGVLSGAPTQRGGYSFGVRVTDSTSPTANVVEKGYTGNIQQPTLSLAQSSYSIVQGAPASFTIGVNGGVAPYSFLVEPVPPNALPAGLSLSSTGQITGTPTASGTFTTTIRVGDASTGSGQYFELETLTINVTALPTVTIAASPASVQEDGATNLTYTVTRSVALSTPTVVNLTTGGTATSGTDYTGGVTSVTIPANAVQATVVIDPTVDSTVEPDETVTLTVAAGAGYAVGASASATGTILNDDNQLATITVSPAAVAEDGAANLVYTVNLTGPATTSTSVNFTVAGTATSGTDYAAVTSPLIIPAGSASGTITIDPTADGTIEPDETVVITLTAGTGYTLGAPASATGTIQADEVLTLNIAPTALNAMTAGDAFTQTLTASGGTGPYTFSIDAGALPTGLTLAADGTISGIPTRRGAYSVTVRVQDSLGAIGARTFSGTVFNAIVVTSPTTFSFAQGVPVNTVLTTTGGVPPYRSYLVTSGTLPAGLTLSTDGVISGTPTTVGSSTVTARVADSSTPGTAFTGFSLTINIVNLPTVSVAVSPASTGEDGAANLVYTVTRDLVAASPLTVNLTTAGTASSGSDYSGAVASVTIPANAASATVTINPVGDAVIEPNETVILTIASDAAYLIGSPSSATGTITNDDFPTASLALAPASAAEDGPTNMTVTVALDAPAPEATSVNFTLGGTAINGADYAPLNSPLVIPAGASNGTLVINPNTDGLMESDETVVVALAAGSGYQVGSPASVTATILNDDFPSISINGATVAEGNSGTTNATFTISLSSPALAGGVTFDIATADGTATAGTDYTAQSMTGLTIPAGSTTATFTVPVIGDLLNELSETYFVNLTNVTNATLAGVQGLGTIVDDDLPPTITINDVSVVEENSGTTSAVFTVSMSAPSAKIVTASFVTANGTATTPADFVAASGAVTFAPGETTQTISVSVVGDILPEADETFLVTLTDATNGLIIDRDGLGTIVNDDVPVTVLPNTLPGATVGVAYNSTISATGGASPYSFAVTGGTLPTGLNLTPSGQLSGVPTAGGTFNVTITATDSSAAPGPFSESRAYTIVVASPTITLPATSLPGGQSGTSYSAALTAATGGTAPFTYNVTDGALPTGLSLSTSGTITGTPSVFGTFAFTVTATDSSTGTGPYAASQSYTVEILPATPVAGAVSVNLPYGAPQTAVALNLSGGAATAVSVVTAPSNGIATVDGIGISYRPDPSFSGTDSFTYTATNSGGTSQPATVTITVAAPTLTVSATGPLTATVGVSYNQSFNFAGGSAPFGSYQVNGLPAGVTITGTTSNSVTISGVPRAQGTFAVSVSAVDSSTGNGPFTASEVFSLSVGAPSLALDPASGSFDAAYAAPFSRSFTASGGIGGYSYAKSGALPAGLTFDAGSGTISGSPTQAGSFPITVIATDIGATGPGAPFTVSGSYTITVAAPIIVILPGTLPGATVGVAYNSTISTSGGASPYSLAVTGGALPTGLSLAPSGQLSGVPTAGGTFSFTVTATDSSAAPGPFTASRSYTIIVASPTVTLPATSLPGGQSGTSYSAALTAATGGTAPFTYNLTGGALPTGLSLSTSGTITGTPSVFGTFAFTVTATDSSSGTGPYAASQSYTVEILPATPVAGAVSVSLPYGAPTTPVPLNLSGGVPTAVEIVTDAANGVLTVDGIGITYRPNPSFSGIDSFTYKASNLGGTSQPATVTVTVDAPTLSVTASGPLSTTVGASYSQTFSFNGGAEPFGSYQVTGLPAGVEFTESTPDSATIAGIPRAQGTFAISVSAIDSSIGDGPFPVGGVFNLNVGAPNLVLAPASGSFDTAYAAAFTRSFTASGGIGGYSYAISGALPAGLTFDKVSGTLSGSPTQAGSFPITVIATDTGATGPGAPFTVSGSYTITVAAPIIVISPGTLPGASVGVAYSSTISANGGASPYSFAITGGALPTGLSLAPSGQLTGTPSASGSFSFTVTATDSNVTPGPFTESRSFTLEVAAPLVTLPTASLSGGQRGAGYSATLAPATGGTAPYSYAVTAGALPSGLALSQDGTISGVPSAFGSFGFTVTATDSSTGTGPFSATASYSITIVDAAPVAAASNAALPYAAPASPVVLNLSGGAATSLAIVAPPANGTASVDGLGISYRPNSGFSGTDSFTYTASNAGGTSQAATVTITVAAPDFAVTATGSLSANVGVPYTQTFSFAGGSAPFGSYRVDGLPAGVELTGTSSNSVTIAGIPRAQGTFAVSVSALDSSTGNGPFTASEVFNLSVGAPNLVLDPASGSLDAAYATPFSRRFTASGGVGPYSYALSGALPNGLTFDGVTGTISGEPLQSGAFPVTITATDTGSTGAGGSFTVSGNLSINVAAPTIVVTPTTLPNATSGATYAVRLAASGAVAPYTFSLKDGALPAGLTLSAEGDLSGTPTASGTFAFTVTARDANGQSSAANLTLVVDVPSLAIQPETLPAASQGIPYSQRLSTTGGVAPYRYAVTTGTLPAGLALDPATGVISGTPTVSGTVSFAVTVTDSTTGTAATGTITYALEITARPDPALDPEVRGLIQAQVQSSRRLASTQVNNFMRRLEAMRGTRRGNGFQNGLRLTGPGYCEDSITAWTSENCRAAGDAQANAATNSAKEPVADYGNGISEGGEQRWTVWTGGSIRFGDRDAQSGRLSQEFNSEGISLGADYQFSPSFAAGLGVGIGRDETDVGENGSRSDATAKTVAAYGSHTLGKGIYLEWLGGYQWLEFDLRRYVTSTGSLVNSTRSGHQWFATGSLGAEIATGSWLITPYSRLDLVRGRLDGYSETSDTLWDLRFLDQDIDFTSVGLGAIIAYEHRFKRGSLLPRLRAEYLYDLERNADAGVTYRDLLSGPVSTVTLTGIAREQFMLGLGTELQLGSATFDLDYLNRMASGSGSDQTVQVGVSIRY